MNMKIVDKSATVLAGVGAVNWGLATFLSWNAVGLLDSLPMVQKLVYGVIAISGVYVIAKALMK
jgi:uncharacterized membrane protein YuzA (DUF378 family)